MCEQADERACGNTDCPKWVDCPDCGNCVLRVERSYTMAEVVEALHMSQATAYRNLSRAVAKLMEGLRAALVDSSLGDKWGPAERRRKPNAE